METYELEGDSRLHIGERASVTPADPILISSDEEDNDGIAFVGSSRVLVKPHK